MGITTELQYLFELAFRSSVRIYRIGWGAFRNGDMLRLSVDLIYILSAAGCSPTKIGDILDDPTQFEGTEVEVKGTVGGTVWFALLERGAY